MKAITGISIYDFEELKINQFVIFDSHIRATGTMDEYSAALDALGETMEDTIDGSGRLLMPGLALCHTHIYSTFSRGMALPFNPTNFQELLDQLWWKLDGALTHELVRSSAEVSALGYLHNGVTAIIDHHASGRGIRGSLNQLKEVIVDDFGLKGMFCFETSDRFDVQDCIDENLAMLETATSQGQTAAHFGLHASMSLSDETLSRISKVLNGQPIHIHCAESSMDQDDCVANYGMRVIERLDKFALITPESIIVHGIYLSDREMEIIAERGAWMAVNPSSNMNNGVGLPDVRRLLEKGVKVMLGNDGMGTSVATEWSTLVFAMHHRYQDPVSFGLGELAQIIRNGYDYFNTRMDSKIGRIQSGYDADMVLIDYCPPTPMNSSNALGHLVYSEGFSLRPSHVWTRGSLRLENYRPLADEAAIHKRSRELSAALWSSLE